MITVYPIGTTIFNPEKAYGGYTLLNFLHEPEIVLFDMNGKVVNTWMVERGPKEPTPGQGSAASPLRAQGRSSGCRAPVVGHLELCPPAGKRQHARAQGVRLGQ